MRGFSNFILVFILLFAITACKKDKVYTNFEENIKIKMSEDVDSVKRVLNLYCYTEKIFPCVNYPIEATYSLTTDKITIYFSKIIIPGMCLTSPGPASTTIKLTDLSNKIYQLELNFGATSVSGQLAVTANSFIATLPPQTKAQFVNPDLKRIPDNTIYGSFRYTDSATISLGQKFIDTLRLYGAAPTLYVPGDYTAFQIEANGQIWQNQNTGHRYTLWYIYHYTNNSSQLKSLVRRFGVSYPNGLNIDLYTTKGEAFFSWIP